MSETSEYSQGLQLLRSGRPVEAARLLASATASPGLTGQLARFYRGRALREAGLAHARAGQFDQAQAMLRQAIDTLGADASLAAYLAGLYTRTGQPARAEAYLEAACQYEPDEVRHAAALAALQLRNGTRERAMMTLQQALRRHGDSAILHVQLGLMHAGDERYADARHHLTRAIACDCLHAQAHYHLGLVAAAEGDFPAALRSLERAHTLQPGELLLTYQLAAVARVARGSGQSVELRLQSAEPAPPARTHLEHLANFVCQEHDFVDAFLALPPSPADEELFGLLAAVLETALETHGRYADLHYHRARVADRLGQASLALHHARKAVSVNPDYVAGRILLGRLLAEAEPVDALAQYTRALSAGGDYPDVHAARAELLQRLGRTDEARSALARALELNATYHPARDALRRLAA